MGKKVVPRIGLRPFIRMKAFFILNLSAARAVINHFKTTYVKVNKQFCIKLGGKHYGRKQKYFYNL